MILRHFGLEPEKDVKFAPGGLAEGRLARLQQGLIDATVVPVPLDLQARKLGLNVLARAYEIFTYPDGGLKHRRFLERIPISGNHGIPLDRT